MKVGVQVLFDCVLDINGQKYQMKPCLQRVELELTQGEQVCLLFYPTTSGHISYAAHIKEHQEKLIVECPYATVAHVGESEFELEFAPFTLATLPKKISKGRINGYDIWLLMGEQNHVFVGQSELASHTFVGQVDDHEFLSVFGKPAIKVWQKQTEKMFVFCAQKQQFDIFEGQITVDQEIQVISPCHDYAGQAYSKTFVYEGEELVCKNSELLYLHSGPNFAKNVQVVPFAFFEAVKAKNFLLAKQYLAQDLANAVSMEMLEQYFGTFEKIKPYNFFRDKGYYVCVIGKNHAKTFRIKMKNEKIEEIEQIHPSK